MLREIYGNAGSYWISKSVERVSMENAVVNNVLICVETFGERAIYNFFPGRAKSIKSTLTDLSTPNPNKIKISNLIGKRGKGDFVPN